MKITPEQLRAFVGAPGDKFAGVLTDASDRWDINTQIDLCHWLSQWAHETQGFTKLRENLNYSAEALIVKFRGRITQEDAFKYGRVGKPPYSRPGEHAADQVEIANRIYGGEWGKKNLGNTQPGDGSRFPGRGFPHVTGRDNYTRCSKAIYGDDTLVYRPEFLERPWDAAQAGGWYWHANKLSEYAQRNDVHAITMKVTGWDGTGDGAGVGFAQRCERLRRAILIF